MAKKEIKPLVKKNFDLQAYKAVYKLDDGVKDKELEWIPLSSAFQTVTGLSGIPKGVVSILRGFSNTGKSTALVETAIGCQRTGILPVIIDTENGWNWQHAKDMGFEFQEEDILGSEYEELNEETGEVIIKIKKNYVGFFLYINNQHLINMFAGKRDVAVIEDVAAYCNKTLKDQETGDLPYELCFLWDSIGTLDCLKSYESESSNNQWNAGAMEQAFKMLINFKIPGSRKENKPYTNTMVVVNKIWLDNMQGAGVIKNKGGEAFFYGSRLIVHFGGIQSHATKKLFAKADGKDYNYGTQTKVAVEKNHINGASYKGELISTAHGFILPTEVEQYKKDNKKYILNKLGINKDVDIEFTAEDIFTDS